MKKLLLLILISTNALAIECEWHSERKYNGIKEELVMEGKGIREINEILLARIRICQEKCGERITTFQGLCMAKVKAK